MNFFLPPPTLLRVLTRFSNTAPFFLLLHHLAFLVLDGALGLRLRSERHDAFEPQFIVVRPIMAAQVVIPLHDRLRSGIEE